MRKVIVTCELITPLFMYGAEENVEIRGSSIKGLLRYWWRTYNQGNDFKSLKEKEDKIFGSKGKKSLVSIKINTEKFEISNTTNSEIKRANYLFYSLKLENDKRRYKMHKLPQVDKSFDIEFRYKDENKKILEEYLKALNLMQLLGGMGSRSRRGAGNFIITDVQVKNDNILETQKKQDLIFSLTIDNFERELAKKLDNLRNEKINDNEAGEYPNIVGRDFSVYTFKSGDKDIETFDNWEKALSKINSVYENFRKNEYEKFGFTNEAKAIFGLPLFHGKFAQKHEFSTQKKKEDGSVSLDRLPSPIVFKIHKTHKIHKTDKDKYILLIIRLSDKTLNNYYKIYTKNKNARDTEVKLKNKENKNLIDIFLKEDSLKKIY